MIICWFLTGIDELNNSGSDLSAMAHNFRDQASKLVDMLDISIPSVAKLKRMLDQLPSQHLPDICASIVKASVAEKLQVLDAVDLDDRFRKTLPLLMRQIEVSLCGYHTVFTSLLFHTFA